MTVQLPTGPRQDYGTIKNPLPTMNLVLMEDNSIRGTYLGDPNTEPYRFNLFYPKLTLNDAQLFDDAFNQAMSNSPDVDDVDFVYHPDNSNWNGYFLERPIMENIKGNLWNVTVKLWGIKV